MKKILFLIESLGGGGAEKVLSDIIQKLNKTKYDVTVCTVIDKGVYEPIVSANSHCFSLLKTADYNAGGFKKAKYWFLQKAIYHLPKKAVYTLFIRNSYDVEVAFLEGFSTSLIAASKNLKSKKIAWIHTSPLNLFRTNSNFKISDYKNMDLICCVAKSIEEELTTMCAEQINTIVQYNPIDVNRILQLSEEPIELSSHPTLQLGTIGRLETPKGFLRLIDCLGKLQKLSIDYSLWIIGVGSQKGLLESTIKYYHLENKVVLLGFQDNPYKYLRKCDAFICSSYVEGFSTAATEAIILGKPVFTTDCSGMRELFGTEKCGEIVDNNDEALLYMLKKILLKEWDPNKYIKGTTARSSSFDFSARMSEIEHILDQ